MRGPGLARGTTLAAALLCSSVLVACGGSSSSQPAWVTQQPSGTASASGGGGSASAASTGSSQPMASATGTTPAAGATVTVKVTEPDAKLVQRELLGMNYSPSESGTYDAPTRAAIKRFQTAQHLPATGIVDQATAGALVSAFASFQATATRTDSAGYIFDGAYWRVDDYYRSKNRQCVVYEQNWQQAVVDDSNSRAVAAHDAAARLGCNPDSWTPSSWYHSSTNDSHVDGQACTEADKGTIAKGSIPWTVCNEVSDNVFRWKAMPN